MILFIKFLYLLKKLKIESVLVTSKSNFALWAFLARRLFAVPYTLVYYGAELLNLSPAKLRIVRATSRKAKSVIAISEATRKIAVDMKVSERQVSVINPGVDVSRFRPGLDCSVIEKRYELSGKKVILTVSRFVQHKGQENLLYALREVADRIPHLKCLVVGNIRIEEEKKLQHLKRLTAEIGIQDTVIFTGYVMDEELPLFYNAADVFVLPTFTLGEGRNTGMEGFGIVYMEAGACAKPVVAGRSGGTEDAILHNETGFLVDPANIREISDAVIKLLSDPALCADMGRRGRERAERLFDWKIIGRRVRDFL